MFWWVGFRRVLPVSKLSDDVKARLQRRAKRHGRSLEAEVRDILAGIARSRGAALATRYIKDFRGLGIPLIDPWET